MWAILKDISEFDLLDALEVEDLFVIDPTGFYDNPIFFENEEEACDYKDDNQLENCRVIEINVD